MRYFVVADDGNKYGPADIAALNSWIAEGRLLPSTLLEEEGSGSRIAAGAIPGLNFPSARAAEAAAPPSPYANAPAGPGNQNPYSAGFAQSYNQASSNEGNTEVIIAWILGAIGLVFCGLGWLLGGIGIFLANAAKTKGHPNGKAAFTFNIVVVVISVVVVLLYVVILVPIFMQAKDAAMKMPQGSRYQRQMPFPTGGN